MFTGIVEQMGTVRSAAVSGTGRRLVIAGDGLGELASGASISVNGVCLTAVESKDDAVTVDVIPETLSRTNLGEATAGTMVNLERPMPASGSFDGHIVQGHVDGIGTIVEIAESSDGAVVIVVEIGEDLTPYVVEKGSVAMDGVSLTVAGISESSFSVALIPHTLEVTTLGLRRVGDTVNLETDVLAKYVERLLKVKE